MQNFLSDSLQISSSLGSVIRVILVSFGSVIFTLILYDSQFFALVPAHLSKHPPLPDFIYSLSQSLAFTSKLSLRFWTSQLVPSLDKWSLPSGSLFGQGHCLSSEFGGYH